ncbi:MAG: hypothetical protein OXN97_03790 [Bryobacterales bacterium]|nr:hypothetical protein [Bryobacterales bacterium]
MWFNLPLDLRMQRPPDSIQIVSCLEIDPELGRRPEVAPKAKRGINADATTAPHDVVQTRPRNIQRPGKPIHAEPQRHQEFVSQNLTWMNRWQLPPGSDIGEVDRL